MSLFPIKNDSIDGTLNTPTDSVYKNGFRMNGDQVCMSTGAHASYSQGVSLDSNGAVRVVDVTSGIPAGAQWQNGLLLNSTGALCYSSGAVGSWLNGLPMSSNGAHIANTLIPTPTRSFSFTTGVLDSAITFTRASGATYTDSTGTLQLATSNTPRFDYDPVTLAAKGLLIEEQRTNLLTYSDQFDNAAWVKSAATVTTNASVSPDGTLSSDKLVEDTSNNNHIVIMSGVTVANATAYTFSVYVKAAGRNRMRIYSAGGGFSVANTVFNLSTGVIDALGVGHIATMTSAGNGFYRCAVTLTSIAASSAGFQIRTDNGTTDGYTGDGTSGLYIWGAQLEAGSFATSYIPTTTAQATRAADVAVVTGTNFSSWYNQSEGTSFVEGDVSNTSAINKHMFCVSDGTINNFIAIRDNAGGTFQGVCVSSGAAQADMQIGAVSANANQKLAMSYLVNQFNFAANGSLGATDTSGTVPSVNSASIGNLVGVSQYLNGHIKAFAYWNTRLTNSQLQTITT